MDVSDQDYHNFSSSSSHRLPTVSGIEAIRNAKRNAQPISTSLARLDSILGKTTAFQTTSSGGIQRGVVTEVFGPPGVGKTTFAIQVAVNALLASGGGTSITWIDTSSSLVTSRLTQIATGYQIPEGCHLPSSPPEPRSLGTQIVNDHFNHLQITSLPRLLTLFLHPSTSFPPPNTSVIVLDDLSNLMLSSLPHSSRPNAAGASSRGPSSVQDVALSKRVLTRRFQVLSSFASGLHKFAAIHSIAILVTTKATVNMKVGHRAVLRPALTSQQWDGNLQVRIALFRDYWREEKSSTQEDEGGDYNWTVMEKRGLRFAKVMRLGGKLVSSREVGFVIEEGGLRELAVHQSQTEMPLLPLATQPLHPLEEGLEFGINDAEDVAYAADVTVSTDKPDAFETPLPEALGTTKRKAIEIADSEEELENETDPEDDSRPPQSPSEEKGGDSSAKAQTGSIVVKHDVSFSTAKKLRADIISSQNAADNMSFTQPTVDTRQDEDQEGADEMLLESYERAATPFSRDVAEMSDPLTPSDDGRDFS